MNKQRIVIDIDAGSDDAFALILLLEKNVEIVAITCVNGNTTTENVYRNVKRILKICNREEIPVYLGAYAPLTASNEDFKNKYHGNDGFGDLEYEDDDITVKCNVDKGIKKDEFNKLMNNDECNAIYMLNKIIKENPKEITLICLGPLTNIALAIKVYSNFSENIKDVYIMGGNIKAIGNVTSTAEFNFHVDPEAAYIVLHFLNCPITILPWEACLDSTLTFDWRFNVLGNLNHPTLPLLNAVEKSIYNYPNCDKYWLPCDAFLTAFFLRPEIAKSSFSCNVSVELHGHKTRAQMVINRMDNLQHNAKIIKRIDHDLFKILLLETFKI